MKPRLLQANNSTHGQHHSLISRLFRVGTSSHDQMLTFTHDDLTIRVIDTGEDGFEEETDRDTLIHVLWQEFEAEARIDVDRTQYPIRPGDSILIPPDHVWHLSRHQLVVIVGANSSRPSLLGPPAHGADVFHDSNRETIISSIPGYAISRWKLTGAYDFVATSSARIIISLYGDVAIRWEHGIEWLPQGNIILLPAGIGSVSFIPDGLTYILVITKDDE